MTGVSAGIKNLFGVIPGLEKPQLHYMWPDIEDFSNMLLEIARTVKPDLTIVDAIDAMEGEGSIVLTAFCEDNHAVVEVSDTGKGIPRNMFRTVFTPGFTTKKRGWGLGLSLAKRIVEEYHHGRIYVKSSEVGHGTTFRIELKIH